MVTSLQQTLTDTVDRLQTDLGLSASELASALGVTTRTLARWRHGEAFPQREARQRIDELVALRAHLFETFTADSVPKWLRDYPKSLGGVTPAELISLGRFDRVEWVLGVIDHGIFA